MSNFTPQTHCNAADVALVNTALDYLLAGKSTNVLNFADFDSWGLAASRCRLADGALGKEATRLWVRLDARVDMR
jgi:hypothetical protein